MRNSDDFGVRQTISKTDERDRFRALKAQERREDQKNSKFTQVSPKGWERIRELSKDKQGVAAIALYSFLAEHIDPTCGAVVAEQQFWLTN